MSKKTTAPEQEPQDNQEAKEAQQQPPKAVDSAQSKDNGNAIPSGNEQPVEKGAASTPAAQQKKTDSTSKDRPKQPAPAAKPAAPKQGKSGRGVALLALLLAVISLAFSIWLYQQSTLQARAGEPEPANADEGTNQQLAELQQRLSEQNNQLDALRMQIAALPSNDNFATQERTLQQLQSAHQAFSMRFEAAFGNTRQDWRLAEAEHLLRMAILRLNAMQDLASALSLIEGVDQILFEQNDVAAYPAREAIAKALADIKSTPQLDRTGLFVRLGALQPQVKQLDQLLPGYSLRERPVEAVTDSAFWRQWLDQLSSYVRLDFNSPDDIQPLLSSQEVTHIRLALSLALEQAQWGALNGQQQTYDQAMEQALQLLQHYFAEDNQAASSLTSQLQELSGEKVSQSTPDIMPALLSLQAYIHDRTMQYRTRDNEEQE